MLEIGRRLTIAGFLSLLMAVLVMVVPSTVGAVEHWFGTAPFCSGSCPAGWTQVASTSCCGNSKPAGCGNCCWTGRKVKCRSPGGGGCSQVRAKCYGIVLVCETGHYELSGAWVTCWSNPCGVCFGFGWAASPPAPQSGENGHGPWWNRDALADSHCESEHEESPPRTNWELVTQRS